MVSDKEKNILRSLADQWMEFASLPVMKDKIRLWKSVCKSGKTN
jgi:hypothetical protein